MDGSFGGSQLPRVKHSIDMGTEPPSIRYARKVNRITYIRSDKQQLSSEYGAVGWYSRRGRKFSRESAVRRFPDQQRSK
jgi:hypothetical protein